MVDFVNKNTGSSKRTSSKVVESNSFNPGPFEAEIVSHLDTSYMGGLEVRLLTKSGTGNSIDTPGEVVPVKYLSPFYGVTPNKGITNNSGHQNTQKSYGMWFVPPDIGSRVLVIFVEGGQGYWIGCIQDDYMNMMLPGGIPSTTYNDSGENKPVAEYNKKTEEGTGRDPTQYIKPENTYACERLQEQGLDKDCCRGLTTSSARRELPSSVFGLSTPGPIVKGGPKVRYGGDFAGLDVPHDRYGGSSLVFDDGDYTLRRKQHAKDGPPEYANLDAGESSDEDIFYNEMVKLRTRTGHEIILHNSEDLIYIINSRGTAWIELTSNGKIDVFSNEDVSVGAERDINLHAERDIHIEAKEEIHMKSGKNTYILSEKEYHVKSQESTFILSEQEYHVQSNENMFIQTDQEYNLKSNENMFIESGDNFDLNISNDGKITAGGKLENKSGDDMVLDSGGDIDYSASNHTIAGQKINLLGIVSIGGGSAGKASSANGSSSPENPEDADGSPRIPRKEPWDEHENLHGSSPKPVADTFKKGK